LIYKLRDRDNRNTDRALSFAVVRFCFATTPYCLSLCHCHGDRAIVKTAGLSDFAA